MSFRELNFVVSITTIVIITIVYLTIYFKVLRQRELSARSVFMLTLMAILSLAPCVVNILAQH